MASGISFEVSERAREQIKRMLPFKPTGAQTARHSGNCERYEAPTSHESAAARRCGQRQNNCCGAGGGVAIENGYQVAVLAPTEILAAQHFAISAVCLKSLATWLVFWWVRPGRARSST